METESRMRVARDGGLWNRELWFNRYSFSFAR